MNYKLSLILGITVGMAQGMQPAEPPVLADEAEDNSSIPALRILAANKLASQMHDWDSQKLHQRRPLMWDNNPVAFKNLPEIARELIAGRYLEQYCQEFKPQVLAILSGHTKRVEQVAVSPDGNQIISSSQDLSVRRWSRLQDGYHAVQAPLFQSTLEGEAPLIALSPDGNNLAISWDKRCDVWSGLEGNTFQHSQTLNPQIPYTSLLFNTPNSLLTASREGDIRVFSQDPANVHTNPTLNPFQEHQMMVPHDTEAPAALSCNATGTQFVARLMNDDIRIGRRAADGTFEILQTRALALIACTQTAMSPDASLLAVADHHLGAMHILTDLAAPTARVAQIMSLSAFTVLVKSIVFLGDNNRFAASTGNQVVVWKRDNPQAPFETERFLTLGSSVWAMAWNAADCHLICGLSNGNIVIIDPNTTLQQVYERLEAFDPVVAESQ